MKSRRDEGMTILEVVFAMTILLIGIGFVAQSNSLSYRFLGQQELRQQMVFFAAGAMEAALEKELTETQNLTSDGITAKYSPVSIHGLPQGLTPFKVSVSVDSPGVSKVEMYNYRYNYDEH